MTDIKGEQRDQLLCCQAKSLHGTVLQSICEVNQRHAAWWVAVELFVEFFADCHCWVRIISCAVRWPVAHCRTKLPASELQAWRSFTCTMARVMSSCINRFHKLQDAAGIDLRRLIRTHLWHVDSLEKAHHRQDCLLGKTFEDRSSWRKVGRWPIDKKWCRHCSIRKPGCSSWTKQAQDGWAYTPWGIHLLCVIAAACRWVML